MYPVQHLNENHHLLLLVPQIKVQRNLTSPVNIEDYVFTNP